VWLCVAVCMYVIEENKFGDDIKDDDCMAQQKLGFVYKHTYIWCIYDIHTYVAYIHTYHIHTYIQKGLYRDDGD
jgi:hypothetical protein